MGAVNETVATFLSSSQSLHPSQYNPEPLSALDKFTLAIVKANDILDANILPLGISALAMANENATIDEIAMWIAARRKDKRDNPEYEANLIQTRKLLGLI